MKIKLRNILSECLPFVSYLNLRKILLKRRDANDILSDIEFDGYTDVNSERLLRRIKEEHERAHNMDEKTFKLSLSISAGIAFLSLTATYHQKIQSSILSQFAMTTILGITLFYFFVAIFLALGSRRTEIVYGFGTQFLIRQEIDQKSKIIAESLARQETMNLIRNNRNAATYTCIRNGFIFLVTGAIILFSEFVNQTLL